MKRGLILVNAYTRSESELNQPRRIAEELSLCGVEAEIKRNTVPAVIGGKAPAYDFCVYLDKDKYAARALEARGLRLFNRAEAVETCDDKMLTFLALEGAQIPMPRTIAAPLCYTPEEPVSKELLREAETLGYPLIVKECFGSLGKGVYKADDRAALTAIAERLKGKPHLFQEYIAKSAGRDLRVTVVGGRAIAAMVRTSADFRSNLGFGGSGERAELDEDTARLCEKIADRLRLDYCGIDLLFGGRMLLCEVNSNAFFGGTERVTGVNVARAYAEHIVKEIYGRNGV